MTPAAVIAIDGPAGSGKSTIGRDLADRLGYLYFDTGVLYRALTWLALDRGIDVEDATGLARLADSEQIDVLPATVADGRQCTVTVADQDITWAIREPAVDASVSVVAAHSRVRAALLPVQRRIVARGGVVIVGRDIGTVVAPEAPLKVYLQASLDVRAERRWRDLRAQGHADADLAQVRADLERRDRLDSRRETAPLAIAADAILVENDHVTVPELVDLLADLARGSEKGGRN